jgi:hypothetical protein
MPKWDANWVPFPKGPTLLTQRGSHVAKFLKEWVQHMQLSAVHLARVIFFVEAIDLNPRGAAYYPEIVHALVERYGFQKYPQKPEEFDESKGVLFEQGRISDVTIDRLIIFENGLQLDTTRGTEESEAILLSALTWATQSLGIVFKPEMVKRKAYVSQFSFYSEAPLLRTTPILNHLAENISAAVSDNLRTKTTFEPSAILIGQDPEGRSFPVSAFSIERRAQAPFSDNKYFTAAPLPTELHLALVSDYEGWALSSKT